MNLLDLAPHNKENPSWENPPEQNQTKESEAVLPSSAVASRANLCLQRIKKPKGKHDHPCMNTDRFINTPQSFRTLDFLSSLRS